MLSDSRNEGQSILAISHFVEFLYAVMHVYCMHILFCSAWQVKTWYELLEGQVGEVSKEEQVVEPEKSVTETVNVFKVEGKPLHSMPPLATINSGLPVRQLQQMLVHSAPFTSGRTCPSIWDVYSGRLHGWAGSSAYPELNSVVTNVPHSSVDETLLEERARHCLKIDGAPEKSTLLAENLVRTFSKADKLMFAAVLTHQLICMENFQSKRGPPFWTGTGGSWNVTRMLPVCKKECQVLCWFRWVKC